ncbi:MAG: mitochondrial inner membrane protein required for protein import [Piccolia ochrophora]|nr:MAG: mitochondrial inner membrane protein required for protein import [Piccolia ochrophora]
MLSRTPLHSLHLRSATLLQPRTIGLQRLDLGVGRKIRPSQYRTKWLSTTACYRSAGRTGGSQATPKKPRPRSDPHGPLASSSPTKPTESTVGPTYSKGQDEFASRKMPSENTVPQSTGGGPGITRAERAASAAKPDISILQDEFRSSSPSATGNTDPQPPSSSAVDPVNAGKPSRPLPDLTQGIPSTLDAEVQASTEPSRNNPETLNLTEDPSRGSTGRGGKGGGELPSSAYVSSFEQRRLRFANRMYAAFLLLSISGAVFLGRNWETTEEERQHTNAPSGWGFSLFYQRAKARLTDSVSYYTEPAFPKLLPEVDASLEKPYTLVLSLEDLLIHSEWSRDHGWRMAKRPGVDYFLRYLQQYYELVIFTTLPWMTAEPILRKLDPYRMVLFPLFRDATRYEHGDHVKDLSYLNRDLSKVILIDTVSTHAKAQPENAIILPRWTGNAQDQGLVALIPFLEYVAAMGLDDTRAVLKSFEGTDIAKEFAARETVARQKFEQQLAEEQARHPRRLGKGLINSVLGVRPGVGPDGVEQSAAEALGQGKMLQDHIRERGQKVYEALEKEIRENGDKFLAEMAAEEEKLKEEEKKKMNVAGFASVFSGGGTK